MKLSGRIFLLITGIIFIALGLVQSIAYIVEGGSFFSRFIVGLYSVVMGILGIVFRNDFDKARLLMILGIIYLCVFVLTNFFFGAFATIAMFIILPVLYIVGAYKNEF